MIKSIIPGVLGLGGGTVFPMYPMTWINARILP
jgi:hypothetical protein